MENSKSQSCSPIIMSNSNNNNSNNNNNENLNNSSWSSKQALIGEWNEPLLQTQISYFPLIKRTILESGYMIENGNIKAKDYVDEREIYFRESDKGFFRLLLESQNQIEHYYGEKSNEVFIISIELIKEKKFQRVLLRTSKEDQRLLIPGSSISKILKELSIQFSYLRDVRFTKVKATSEEAWTAGLLKFEETQIFTTYKFGILNALQDQITDDDFFNNQTISKDFEEFLEFIGTKIMLKDWNQFRGGLDIKTNKTGDYSVFTTHRGYEIMFHVASYLPFNDLDAQQVERKRHLGNDVNLIIFKEGDTLFDPLEIKSQFNHVFFVIQKATDPEKGEGYILEACCKPGVIPFHPFISKPNFYPKNDEFREFLLTKLINAERAAMFAKDFRVKLTRTRKMLLSALISDEKKK